MCCGEMNSVEARPHFELTQLLHHSLEAGTAVTPSLPLWLTILTGEVALETSSRTDRLGAGDAAWVDRRTASRLLPKLDSEVAMGDLQAVAAPRRLPSPLIVRRFAHRHSGVVALIRTCPLRHTCPAPTFAEGYAALLGAAMVDSWREDEDLGHAEEDDPAIARVIEAVMEDPGRPWSASSMAVLVHLSRSTLGERFRKRLGSSPARMLREIRMGQARGLLAEQSHAVEYVAAAVGYGSLAAFSRAFTRHHGVSPQAWRAQRRGARSTAKPMAPASAHTEPVTSAAVTPGPSTITPPTAEPTAIADWNAVT